MEHKNSFVDRIQSHMTTALLGLGIIFLFIALSLYGHATDFLDFYNKPLSSLSSLAVIVSAIFVAIQVKMAAHQLNAVSEQAKSASSELELLYKDYNRRKEHSEFETAYNLAGHYAKYIIPRLAYLNRFLDTVNRKVAPDYYIKSSQFKNFNQAEAEKVFGKGIISKFQKEFCDPKNMVVSLDLFEFLSSSNLYTPTDNDLKTIFEIVKIEQSQTSKKNKSREKKIVDFINEKFFIVQKDITNIINDLEYFSMYFCAKLAAPDAVYISLHQTYLEVIINAYLFICYKNTEPGHEYYAHAIKLYNTWTAKRIKEDSDRATELARILQPSEPQKMHSA